MSSLKPIFTIDELKTLVAGVPQTVSDEEIRPYMKPAHKAVSDIVGFEVFNEIADLADSPLLEDMKSAVANRLMYDYKLFETITKRQTGQADTYKYELEAMQNTYLSFYYDSVDSVFRSLSDPNCPISAWKESAASKAREELLIKGTAEFNSFYGIDNSDFFFFVSIFLQRMVIDKYLTAFSLGDMNDDNLRRLKSIVARLTVASALRQLDITMLPRTLRNPTVDGAYRHASSEQQTMYALSEYLFAQCDRDLAQLTFEINAPAQGVNLPSETNLNNPEYKFFLMS